MRISLGGLDVDAAPGVTAARLVAFALSRGVALPERPWCGPVRLRADHPVGVSPLVAFARLTSAPGPDARPHLGAHLAVVGGPDAGAVVTLAEEVVIGRGETAGLRLSDGTVSEVHAAVARARVRDLGSRNGTRVHGRRLRRRARLGAVELIEVGDCAISLRDPSLTAEEPRKAPIGGLASGAVATVSMAAFAVMSGHWQLALVALAAPAALAAAALVSRTRAGPAEPLLDVTGTLGVEQLPPGAVAVSGPRGLVRAVTLAAGAPPASARQWEPWMATLPPARRDVAWLTDDEEPPSWTEVLVSAHDGRLRLEAAGATRWGPLPLVDAARADATARRLASRAASEALPRAVWWGELPPASGDLPVRLGMGASGPVTLDLVADGPHLLVAGTTGSGKSEALRTIIASLAHDLPPSRVAFALVDFKGGAGLGPCARLPHVASVLTDLEPHLARRCLLALAAELADRKRAMAAAGATTFAQWHEERPPRLVVVVDEFQEIASADRDFLPQLARLAAQGRSLGIHLILATQRPAGAVGAEIRANVAATLALRTASEAESRDLLGSPAAALIPPDAPGRALLVRGGAVEQVQVALPFAGTPQPIRAVGEPAPPGRTLVEEASARHSGRARPLWLEPLPRRIAPAASGGIVLGVCDEPERRSRSPLTWDPSAGPLVVTGPPRSGRSSTLRSVAAIAERAGLRVVWLPADPRRAVRTLAIALETPDAVLVVDDAAKVLALAATADAEAPELLTAAMRVMPVALAAAPGWATHRLTAAAGLRLVFTGLADQDEAAWDVPRDLRGLPAQAGRVRAYRADGWCEAQLALPAPWTRKDLVREVPITCPPLPANALGVGGDDAAAVLLPHLPSVVIGAPGAERDSVARRVTSATGIAPTVTDTPFGAPRAPIVIVVHPTPRAVREAIHDAPRGLLEPHHVPHRVVASIEGNAVAVQVAPA